MIDTVPFMDVEDEPRIAIIIQELIDSEEVPDYKIFTNEPKQKRDRRHKKYAREAREARHIKKELEKKGKLGGRGGGGESSLEQQIMKNNSNRGGTSESFFEKLIAKYGNNDDEEDDIVDFSTINKLRTKTNGRGKKKVTKTTARNGGDNATNVKLNKVKAGKVQKNKRK